MQLFLDTGNIEEVTRAARWGVITGVTTNPTLLAKSGVRDVGTMVAALAPLVPDHISVEVTAADAAGMVEEGKRYAALAPQVVVKIPSTPEGLEAVHSLKAQGVRTNVTLIFTVSQALLAARAGAAFVSPFVGRLDDVSYDGIALVRETVEIFRLHGIGTEVIAASIRHPLHAVEAARAGAPIATIPYPVLEQMMRHPLTDVGIRKFQQDWEKAQVSH